MLGHNVSMPAALFKLHPLQPPLHSTCLQCYFTAKEERKLPDAMDPSSSSGAVGSTATWKKCWGRPLGSKNKPKLPAIGAPRAGGPPCIGAPVQGGETHAAPRASSALILRDPAQRGAMAALSPLTATMPPPESAGTIDRALREPRRPGPPSIGCRSRGATESGALCDRPSRDPPAA
jgi:hypothetical protein